MSIKKFGVEFVTLRMGNSMGSFTVLDRGFTSFIESNNPVLKVWKVTGFSKLSLLPCLKSFTTETELSFYRRSPVEMLLNN